MQYLESQFNQNFPDSFRPPSLRNKTAGIKLRANKDKTKSILSLDLSPTDQDLKLLSARSNRNRIVHHPVNRSLVASFKPLVCKTMRGRGEVGLSQTNGIDTEMRTKSPD